MAITRVSVNRSLAILLAVVSLIAASCGDSGSTDAVGNATTAAPTTAAPTTASPTTAAPTTAVPTTAAPTTTAAAVPPLPEGSLTGQWNNTTFGSSGTAVSSVGVTGDTMSVSLELTDGNVLGQGISDIFSIDLPIGELANGTTVQTTFLGTMTITINNGQIDVVATDSPVAGISGFTASGTITATSLSGTYEVQFDVGDPAVGTFDFPIG